jgi:hypothetical protein
MFNVVYCIVSTSTPNRYVALLFKFKEASKHRVQDTGLS